MYAHQAKLDRSSIVINKITVVGSRRGYFPAAIGFLEEDAINTVSIISKRFPLEKGVAPLRAAKEGTVLNVLLDRGRPGI